MKHKHCFRQRFLSSLFCFCWLVTLMSCQPAPELPPVTLEFRIADTIAVPGWEQVTILESGETVHVAPNPVLTAQDLKVVKAAEQRWGPDRPVQQGQLAIRFECNRTGAAKLRAATSANLKKRLAIVVDGRVIMAPTIQAAIGESAELTGSFSPAERQHLIDQFERALDSVD